MKFTSAMQLKDWIKNKALETGVPANNLLHYYMMERLLERVSLSRFQENIILKGGVLIAAMVGIDKRSTIDIDATIKGVSINRLEIENIIREITEINTGDGVSFDIKGIKNIHETGDYDDFRISLQAMLHTVRVNLKIDFTVGDIIVPGEVEYPYMLMFEKRAITIMAYSLYTILAEKIETILSRNVTNTRARDFYDIYILLSLNRETLSKTKILNALEAKAKERNSIIDLERYAAHLANIADSPEIASVWSAYCKNYPYADGIGLHDIISLIAWVFE